MMLSSLGRTVDAVVVLDAGDQVLTDRISGRRSCRSCGSVYNTVLAPPKREGVCDNDGTPLFHRADDQADTALSEKGLANRRAQLDSVSFGPDI